MRIGGFGYETFGFRGTGDAGTITVRADILVPDPERTDDEEVGLAVSFRHVHGPDDPRGAEGDRFQEEFTAWFDVHVSDGE